MERIRSIAHRGNYQVHDVTAYKVDGRVSGGRPGLDLQGSIGPALRQHTEPPRGASGERYGGPSFEEPPQASLRSGVSGQ